MFVISPENSSVPSTSMFPTYGGAGVIRFNNRLKPIITGPQISPPLESLSGPSGIRCWQRAQKVRKNPLEPIKATERRKGEKKEADSFTDDLAEDHKILLESHIELQSKDLEMRNLEKKKFEEFRLTETVIGVKREQKKSKILRTN